MPNGPLRLQLKKKKCLEEIPKRRRSVPASPLVRPVMRPAKQPIRPPHFRTEDVHMNMVLHRC
ncbi:hypothetical protein BDFG_07460 [Blastomyces dermatitidis ATCC 26199]|nr:hypothetical protein BDFG_07460 [Blastomyces dermatitidis ATCC 26199]